MTGPAALPRAVRELCWLCRALTLPPPAFQLLDCTDFEDVSDHVLYVVHIHLRSKNLVLRRMAVTSLVTLSGRPEQVSRGSRAQGGHPPGAGLQAMVRAVTCSGFASNRERRERCPPLLLPSSAAPQHIRPGPGLRHTRRDLCTTRAAPSTRRVLLPVRSSIASQNKMVSFTQAATLQYLLPRVSQQLRDDDCEVRTAALTVLSNVLCLVDRQTALTIALQLVEMLLPLFENVRRRERRGLVSMPEGMCPWPGDGAALSA